MLLKIEDGIDGTINGAVDYPSLEAPRMLQEATIMGTTISQDSV